MRTGLRGVGFSFFLCWLGFTVQGGEIVVGPPRVIVAQPGPPRMLGSFVPEPYAVVLGNGNAGGGYSPLGMFGNSTLTLDGPLSIYRSQAAPVVQYVRGYNGVLIPAVGTSFSFPNRPQQSPVLYPARSSFFYGFRETGLPPQWDSSYNWIDQN